MPAAPTDWAGRLRFGQRVAGDAYLRLHRDHPRGGRDTVEAPILDAGSVRVDVGQVPRRSCSVRVRERDLPSWLGPTTQIELGARLPLIVSGTMEEVKGQDSLEEVFLELEDDHA